MALRNEQSFIDGLKTTPAQKIVIEALFNDPDFLKIWNYLKKCSKVIELMFIPGLKFGGVERFGCYISGREGKLIINSMKLEHEDNAMELVDTIIHECIDAVMDLNRNCGDDGYPFSKDIHELYLDPLILGRRTVKKKYVDTRNTTYLNKHYGDSASNPKDEYIDINDHGQQLIISIIERLIEKTGIGEKTLTFKNEEKRNPKRRIGCFGVLLLVLLAITATIVIVV